MVDLPANAGPVSGGGDSAARVCVCSLSDFDSQDVVLAVGCQRQQFPRVIDP